MRARSGFTLVELTVALALAGVVVLMAHALFGAIVDGARRATQERARLDREANGRRELAALVGAIDLVSPGAREFVGEPDRVAFHAWTSRRTGWPVLERLTIDQCGAALCASSGHGTLELLDGVDSLGVDYLLNAGANESWARRWRSPSSPPAALRLRVARTGRVDTLLIAVGTRG